uniref:Uncharacterized protein n=1 Tax=Craspedostauros australis TaxID=1486917 RepID=A0A7R9WNU1_9STRA|mmetsp:Transcript_11958/g.32900  ORF Transcript_11958/g.32900 Transcript_11958/m.32900 type:complete len:212 (+) Transcript_11958:273-908(+)|eukprot:CAMPEP_0198116636 /NCGR_PEP_ID=MMETSP1442-20131203/13693_1 /TAXON_ID= /ORGANISM="Craspedostauros australis, Strain CCMP3328" /LENGTH=211 /DNA_ID=CAMNT_0043774509 /DNA_START=237 /DNA_END=872 /DNA_ORIENTATION=+
MSSTKKNSALLVAIAWCMAASTTQAFVVQPQAGTNLQSASGIRTNIPPHRAGSVVQMTSEEIPQLTSFREAEILGLRFMQEGNFQSALDAFEKGMKLPGSRPDIVRTKSLAGPSPVGGSYGGTESKKVLALDDFELQAAHYNMACAHSRLGNLDESIANLAKAFENGFDNYTTVRGDPDLDPIKSEADFAKLMETYESQKAFNPFGFFGKK